MLNVIFLAQVATAMRSLESAPGLLLPADLQAPAGLPAGLPPPAELLAPEGLPDGGQGSQLSSGRRLKTRTNPLHTYISLGVHLLMPILLLSSLITVASAIWTNALTPCRGLLCGRIPKVVRLNISFTAIMPLIFNGVWTFFSVYADYYALKGDNLEIAAIPFWTPYSWVVTSLLSGLFFGLNVATIVVAWAIPRVPAVAYVLAVSGIVEALFVAVYSIYLFTQSTLGKGYIKVLQRNASLDDYTAKVGEIYTQSPLKVISVSTHLLAVLGMLWSLNTVIPTIATAVFTPCRGYVCKALPTVVKVTITVWASLSLAYNVFWTFVGSMYPQYNLDFLQKYESLQKYKEKVEWFRYSWVVSLLCIGLNVATIAVAWVIPMVPAVAYVLAVLGLWEVLAVSGFAASLEIYNNFYEPLLKMFSRPRSHW